MSFGYYRSEVLGALFSTLIIWILTGVLVYLAILRVINQDFEIEPVAMVATASCGVVFNIIMYFVLHTNRCFNGVELKHHGHSHSGDGHGHGHGHGAESNHGHSHEGNNHNHAHSHSSSPLEPITDNYLMPSGNSEDQMAILNDDVDEQVKVEGLSDTSNINLRAAAIHVIGDFIQSVGVLIAAVVILVKVVHFLS